MPLHLTRIKVLDVFNTKEKFLKYGKTIYNTYLKTSYEIRHWSKTIDLLPFVHMLENP